MSQQQVNKISPKKYLSVAQEMLIKQATAYYIQEHFKVSSSYDRHKFLFYSLYTDILCTEDCEIINWVDKKIRGKLDKSIKIADSNITLSSTPDIITNNYYTTNIEANYETVEW